MYAGGTTEYRVRVGSSDYAYLSVTVSPTRSKPRLHLHLHPCLRPHLHLHPDCARTDRRQDHQRPVADYVYATPVPVPTSTPTTAPAQTSVRTAAITRPYSECPPVDPPAVDDPPAQDRRFAESAEPAAPAKKRRTPRATQGFYQTLNNLPPGIEVNNWMMGAQGRRVGALGVGNQEIIDQGLLDAIDLWGYITPASKSASRSLGGLCCWTLLIRRAAPCR